MGTKRTAILRNVDEDTAEPKPGVGHETLLAVNHTRDRYPSVNKTKHLAAICYLALPLSQS